MLQCLIWWQVPVLQDILKCQGNPWSIDLYSAQFSLSEEHLSYGRQSVSVQPLVKDKSAVVSLVTSGADAQSDEGHLNQRKKIGSYK